jgi:YqaJ-like viral recombinase domain
MMTEQNNLWQFDRLGKFTSSEVHKIITDNGKFTVAGETYIRQKAAECLTMEIKPEATSASIEWGYEHENDARIEFEKTISITGTYYGKLNPKFFAYNNYYGGSPDWIDISNFSCADFKCPYNSHEHLINLSIKTSEDLLKIRKEYFIQGQSNMIITNTEFFTFFSYDPRFREDKLKTHRLIISKVKSWEDKILFSIEKAEARKQQYIDQLLNK